MSNKNWSGPMLQNETRSARSIGKSILLGVVIGVGVGVGTTFESNKEGQTILLSEGIVFGCLVGALGGACFWAVAPLRRRSPLVRFLSWLVVSVGSVGVYMIGDFVRDGIDSHQVIVWASMVGMWGIGLGLYDYFWYKRL